MSCLVQPGASYHESPTRTSSLPSRLTSAIATPSERNLPSMVVFFQEIGEPTSAPRAAAPRSTRMVSPGAALFQLRTSIMVDPHERALGSAKASTEEAHAMKLRWP